MRRLTIFLCMAFLFFNQGNSQQIPSFIADSLDIYVERALHRWQIPGAAVLVVKDGKIIIARGYGLKEFGKDEKVDENTLFLIGSNTKAFTGTAMALLEYEGKLKLDDKVVKYLPEFKMKDEWITKNLNLVDIITHRMGYETFQGDFMYWSSELSEDQVIEKFGMLTPKYDFRIKYGYTNAGYPIAGKVIHKVTGLRWESYIRDKILNPLNMNRTLTLSIDFAKSENIAKPHTIVDGKLVVLPIVNIDNMAPCGSMASSINDLAKWIIAQLDSGRYNGTVALPFEVIQRTRKPETIQGRVRHPFNNGHFNLYGLGWGLMDYEGKEIVSHTGGVNGFVTSVTLLPEINLGIAILTNTDQNLFFQSLKWEIIDAYLNLPYRDYDSFMFERSKKQKEKLDDTIARWKDSVAMNLKPEISLTNFEGKYLHEVYGYAKLKKVDNVLELTLQHHPNLKGKLEYIGNNRFLCTYSDPTFGIKVFPFEIEDGKVKWFDLYVDDFIDFQPYRFVKEN